LTTQSIKRTNTDNLDESTVEDLKDSILSNDDSFSKQALSSDLALYLIEAKQTLQLAGRAEYTLGRIAEGQPILPDVDLSPFDAYAQGVSRLHAALKINKNRVAIMDLGSSNGTRVNGQKIVPHVDYPISHNDQIALGKLRIQILMK
jgi:pSer/pThr/pTyr-binding forkhead associated (FHA) protein